MLPCLVYLGSFFLRPKHGQQSQLTILGRLGPLGGSYPYSACLLNTHPVPTYTGPWIPSRPFMFICKTKLKLALILSNYMTLWLYLKRALHQRRRCSCWHIGRSYQCHRTFVGIERSKPSSQSVDPLRNTLPLARPCCCSRNGRNPSWAWKKRWSEQLILSPAKTCYSWVCN